MALQGAVVTLLLSPPTGGCAKEDTMRKTIVAATAAASIAAGALAGSVLGTTTVAGAAETAAETVGWVEEALSGLVDDGTIDQAQADAVESALEEARPWRGFGPGGFGRHGLGWHADLSTVAETLGIAEEELRSAVEDGRTLAEVAAEQGVAVETVVDAIVAAQQERIAEEVAEGELTQEQADELLADAEERVTALVDGELPARPGWHGGGGRHHGHGPESGFTEDGSSDTGA